MAKAKSRKQKPSEKTAKSQKFARPDFLYKYSVIDAIPFILNGESIKVTDPTTFNDPFDCNVPLLDLKKVNLLRLIKREFEKPLGMVNNPLLKQYLISMKPSMDQLAAEILDDSSGLTSHWGELLPKLRVMCLTTRPDNILMWSHYANYHQGAVLKFDANSSIFKRANKVRYEDGDHLMSTFLESTITELARAAVNNPNDDETDVITSRFSAKTLFWLFRYLLIKRKDWEYENEYRLIVAEDSKLIHRREGDEFDTMPFDPQSLKEIYFGVGTSSEKIDSIEKIVNDKFPWVRLIKAKKLGLQLILPVNDSV